MATLQMTIDSSDDEQTSLPVTQSVGKKGKKQPRQTDQVRDDQDILLDEGNTVNFFEA